MPAIMAKKAVVTCADNANAAVVAGHIFEQPGHGVIGIGALVNGLGVGVISHQRLITNVPSDLYRPRILRPRRCIAPAPVQGGRM